MLLWRFENLFADFDEDILMQLYNDIEENYTEMVKEKQRPPNVAFIFDDISFVEETEQILFDF